MKPYKCALCMTTPANYLIICDKCRPFLVYLSSIILYYIILCIGPCISWWVWWMRLQPGDPIQRTLPSPTTIYQRTSREISVGDSFFSFSSLFEFLRLFYFQSYFILKPVRTLKVVLFSSLYVLRLFILQACYIINTKFFNAISVGFDRLTFGILD